MDNANDLDEPEAEVRDGEVDDEVVVVGAKTFLGSEGAEAEQVGDDDKDDEARAQNQALEVVDRLVTRRPAAATDDHLDSGYDGIVTDIVEEICIRLHAYRQVCHPTFSFVWI